jgi:hypothetical protein
MFVFCLLVGATGPSLFHVQIKADILFEQDFHKEPNERGHGAFLSSPFL